MYSVVLAAVLTAGSTAPATGFGWHSSCYGCSGCHGCYGCYGCCGGCYGCYGCYGCCGGCWGSCYGYTCHGCCGGYYSSCYGCWGGCYGCCGGTVVYSYPVYTTYYSCSGCCGGTVVPAPAAPAEKAKEKLPAPMKSEATSNAATVVIAAPADVQITVNGQAIALRGTEQKFSTPDLEPGADYSYVVKASAVRDGQTVSQTRKVMVKAGGEFRVDFSQFAASAPARALATR